MDGIASKTINPGYNAFSLYPVSTERCNQTPRINNGFRFSVLQPDSWAVSSFTDCYFDEDELAMLENLCGLLAIARDAKNLLLIRY
jgi:hypothetical protein